MKPLSKCWGRKVTNCTNTGSGLAISSSFSPPPNISLLSILIVLDEGIWKVNRALPTGQTQAPLSNVNSNVTFVFPPSFRPNMGNQQNFYLPDWAVLALICLLSRTIDFLRARALSQPCFCRNGIERATPRRTPHKGTDPWGVLVRPQARASRPLQTPGHPFQLRLLRYPGDARRPGSSARTLWGSRWTFLLLVVDIDGHQGTVLMCSCGPPTSSGFM